MEQLGFVLQLPGGSGVADPPTLEDEGPVGESEGDVGELLDEQDADPGGGDRLRGSARGA